MAGAAVVVQPAAWISPGGGHGPDRVPPWAGYLFGSIVVALAVGFCMTLLLLRRGTRKALYVVIPIALLAGALFYWVAVAISNAAQSYMGG